MKTKNTKKQSNTNWEQLAKLSDKKIDLSDITELDNNFFKNTVLRIPLPKKAVSLRLDPDVLQWFKNQGKGYQTKINAILRMYMSTRVAH